MNEDQSVHVTWIIKEENQELFEQTAKGFGMECGIIGRPGDIVEAGSADAEVAPGNIAFRVTKPADPEKYFDFTNAWHSVMDQG